MQANGSAQKTLERVLGEGNGVPLERKDMVQHKVDPQGHPPIKQHVRQYSPRVLEAMHEEVKKMLADGVIETLASE